MPPGIYDLKSEKAYRVRDFSGKRMIALAAIGNPEVLIEDLAHYQIQVVDRALFRDHHNFSQGSWATCSSGYPNWTPTA